MSLLHIEMALLLWVALQTIVKSFFTTTRIICIELKGDSALASERIQPETIALSSLPHLK
jgi:hypothetical protein